MREEDHFPFASQIFFSNVEIFGSFCGGAFYVLILIFIPHCIMKNLSLNLQFGLPTDFKKASPEEKLNLFNSLLKGYQEEVDNLTKRAKFGENAFLNIYQKLYEAPDPYLALASIAVSTSMHLVFHDSKFLNVFIR